MEKRENSRGLRTDKNPCFRDGLEKVLQTCVFPEENSSFCALTPGITYAKIYS